LITTAILTGMPRSGTSWAGQLLDASPNVSYKMSPLFSYAFKNRLSEESTPGDWLQFVKEVFVSDDDFLNQKTRRMQGQYPTFQKEPLNDSYLVMKFDRFQNLIEPALDRMPELKVICIIRNPCGAIHSWLTAPREFPADADPLEHWRSGRIKKKWEGDHYGFDDWIWFARLALRLAKEFPQRVMIMRYESLVADAIGQVTKMYEFLGLSLHQQVLEFISDSQTQHMDGDYSVFKNPAVATRWLLELNPVIQDAILSELVNTDLEEFLGLP